MNIYKDNFDEKNLFLVKILQVIFVKKGDNIIGDGQFRKCFCDKDCKAKNLSAIKIIKNASNS